MKNKLIFFTTCIILLGFFSIGFSQTAIEGKVFDAASGEPILFGKVSLYQNDVLLTVTETDIENNFYLSGIDAGIYDIEASYAGCSTQRLIGIVVKARKITKIDLHITESYFHDHIILGYKIPLINLDNTTSGKTFISEEIRFQKSSRSTIEDY